MTKRITITPPTVHLNGTSADELERQVEQAGSACYRLMRALSDAAPNGRDYYVQPDGAFMKACEQHASRVDRVRLVLDELLALSDAIAEQRDDRDPPVFAKSDRVELVSMSDDPDPIATGAKGTVVGCERVALGPGPYWQVSVDWDDGRTLSLCCPPDRVRRTT